MSLIASPPQPPPLSQYQTYTTWPGGVDPTTALYRTDNQFAPFVTTTGGRRKASRKGNRKNSRKSTRKNGGKRSFFGGMWQKFSVSQL